MLSDLHDGFAHVVIAVDLDRLLRSTRDLLAVTDTGARVLTVDGEIDLTTADGEFRATMLAGIARFEVRRKSERQKRANEDRAAKGQPLPGRRRYGYETDGRTPREAEAEVVRRMFRHVAEGGSIYGLTRALAAESVAAGPGKGTWRVGRVRDMLNNPHYGGEVRHLDTVMPSDVIDSIVPRELAQEVRAILSDPTRRTSPGSLRKHWASGLVFCGVCGGPMSYRNGYLCLASLSHPFILSNRLEPFLARHLARALATTDPVATLPGGATVTALVEAYSRNERAVLMTSADRDEGLLSPSTARKRLQALRDERQAIEAQLDRARSDRGVASAIAETARELLGDRSEWSLNEFDDVLDKIVSRVESLDLDRRRELLRVYLYVEVDPGRSLERVRVEHLIATHLNLDAIDPTDYNDGESNGPSLPGVAARLGR
jgi:site-specific DNA recombinase